MSNSKSINVFPLPKDPIPSNRFRERFNTVAGELGIGIEWVEDSKNPLAVDANELVVDGFSLDKYGLNSLASASNKSVALTSIPSTYNKALADDVTSILNAVENERLAETEKSANFHKWIHFEPNFSNIKPVEKEVIYAFEERVMPIIDRIEAKQQFQNFDQLKEWMDDNGGYDNSAHFMFSRFRGDFCAGIPHNYQFGGNKVCSLFPWYPDQPTINGMFTSDISLKEFKDLAKELPSDHEFLRPTTMLSKDKEGKIVSTPIPLHPDFIDDHKQLATALERVARTVVDSEKLDEPTRKQLLAWAKFFRTGSAEDEAIAAQASIDAGESKGNLSIHLGPSESYWKDNTKFPYLLTVGIRNRGLMNEMSKTMGNFQDIEDSLSGVKHYSPREIPMRGGACEVIEAVTTGGFIKTFPLGEPGGFNYPNYQAYKTEGTNRFVMVEGYKGDAAKPSIKNYIAVQNSIFDEPIDDIDMEKMVVPFIAAHELGHNLAALRDHVTPSGDKMGAVFGKHWGSADEPKADLTGIRGVWVAKQKGTATQKSIDEAVMAGRLFNFSKLYVGKKAFDKGLTDHTFGTMLQVGYAFKTGGYKYVKVNIDGKPQMRIHQDKEVYFESQAELWQKIIEFQAAGDLEGFLAFAKEAVDSIPDAADKMVLEAKKSTPWKFINRTLPERK